MISLQQLIHVAPFPEESRKELLDAAPTLSDARKFELEELCWKLISQQFQQQLRLQEETAVLEMTQGEKAYNKEDFAKKADELFNKIVYNLEAQGSKEDLQTVRDKLATISHRERN
jgi:hypothetical protein